jgi:hypothetical protein
MIVDLQVNLETKDGGVVDPVALADAIKSAGLDGAVVTREGELIPNVDTFRQACADRGVSVFAGAKLATNHGLILCILPRGTSQPGPDFATRVEGVYDASAVIDAVEELGGVTVALRPYDRDVPRPMGDHLFSLQGLSACEVQNARLSPVANDLALEAASNMEMPCVGTSCADGVDGLGGSATLFRTSVSSESDLCDAIRGGDCWPVTFSNEVPRPEAEGRGRGERRGGGGRGRSGGRGRGGDRGDRGGERRGGRGGDRGGDRGNRRGGGGDRGFGGGGDRGFGGGGDRGFGGGGDRGFGGGGDRGFGGGGGGRGRRRGGRGRGRGGPVSEDAGNRAAPRNRPLDEEAGNRVTNPVDMDEDIGNRLAPGEVSPFHQQRNAPDTEED